MSGDTKLLRLLVTEDMGCYLFAKSLLERDSIEYMVKGAASRMSYGWTKPWFTEFPDEPVEFWVRSEDVERARRALRDLHDAKEDTNPADVFAAAVAGQHEWRARGLVDRSTQCPTQIRC